MEKIDICTFLKAEVVNEQFDTFMLVKSVKIYFLCLLSLFFNRTMPMRPVTDHAPYSLQTSEFCSALYEF